MPQRLPRLLLNSSYHPWVLLEVPLRPLPLLFSAWRCYGRRLRQSGSDFSAAAAAAAVPFAFPWSSSQAWGDQGHRQLGQLLSQLAGQLRCLLAVGLQ
jgi:hypothetical protein